jgi:ABC-type uncharacterized transport system permease subunit
MDTVIQIGVYSVLVLSALTLLAGAFTFVGHALASEAVEDDPHAH